MAAITVALLLGASPAAAVQQLCVDPSTATCFKTIQDAVDHAIPAPAPGRGGSRDTSAGISFTTRNSIIAGN
jgi:hypothetical protein